MKKLLILVGLAFASLGAWCQALPAPEIAARSYLLFDVNAQQVLAFVDLIRVPAERIWIEWSEMPWRESLVYWQ